jgi:uncharacterized protein (DUF342 family)
VPSDTTVEHRQTVADGQEVACPGALVVEGLIGAARAVAAGEIHAPAGVRGHAGNPATLTAGDGLRARFLDTADVTVAGALELESHASGSRLIVDGVVDCPEATIVGGLLRAARRVRIGTLGSEAGVPTRIIFGESAMLDHMLAELDQLAETSTSMRDASKKKLQQLSQPGRILTSDEKEQHTGLSLEVHTLEGLCAKCALAIENAIALKGAYYEPELRVEKALHAGVILQSRAVAMKLKQTLHGPLRVTREHKGALMIAVGEGAPTEPLLRYAEPVPVTHEA